MRPTTSKRFSGTLTQYVSVGALVVAILIAPAETSPALADSVANVPAELADRVATLLPSIAEIRTKADAGQGSTFLEGSGFVIDPSGLILTNRHVIQGAYEIMVTLPGLPRLIAEPAFISVSLDLALLKVEAARPLTPVKLGDSDIVKVGDPVLLIGNALGQRTALSSGVISAVNCDLGDTMYNHYFQTDGALNHGNSGGPMFNMKDEVIAVNTGLMSSPGNTGSVGLGFSMPINDAKFVMDQFLKSGEVSAGFIGVRGQRITDELAEAFGLKSARGALVTEVDPKSTAAGKIFVGDILLRVNDQDASDLPAVARLVAMTPDGTSIDVHLLRDDTERSVAVTVTQKIVNEKQAMSVLGHAPAESIPFVTPSKPGMTFAPITLEARAKYGLQPNEAGVMITAVDRPSAAEQRQISVGDVIEKIGDHPVHQPSDVQAALQDVTGQHKSLVAVLIRGSAGPRWVALPVEADR